MLRRRPSPLASSFGLTLALVLLPLTGCSDLLELDRDRIPPESTATSGGQGGAGGTGPVCTAFEASSWKPGQKAFRDATKDWGIEGVLAVRVNVLDVDRDGWPDLFVRNGGGPDSFGAGGTRTRFLLRNNGKHSFEDITEKSGITAVRSAENAATGRIAEVAAAADVDGDGDVDVYMAKANTSPADKKQELSELMLNDGKGGFTFGPENNGLRGVGMPAVPVGATFSDVNRDGHVDVFVSHNMMPNAGSPLQDRLFLGDGQGGFTDQTFALGLKTLAWVDVTKLNQALGHTWGWGATSCDLNNDGLPELLSASYGRAPNHLWQASGTPGNMTLVNRSVPSGYAFDPREDWTDNLSAQCHCADNPTDDACDKVPAPPSANVCTNLKAAFGGKYRWNHATDREPWRLGGNSATTTCADLDNDGFMDLLTGEIVHADVGSSSDPAELMFNTGEADVRFERPGRAATGLTREHEGSYWDDGDMNNAVFDFDGDGWQDVYISSSDYPGTRGFLYHQKAPRTFEAVPLEDGIDHLRSAGAIAVDLDRDGDLDLVVGHSRFRCGKPYKDDCYDTTQLRIFENLENDANHHLTLRLEGTYGSNRVAVGARVSVTTCGLTQTRQIEGGHGHQGAQEDAVLTFGLGAQSEAEVTIVWPDATSTTQSFKVAADAFYDVKQGEEPVLVVLP
ncbi:MAG: CRTAC1 family protein [Deltaproteobacteria bacterium]|nr:CRTAC1 family protein [Deltaproteobacteria bacterium]